MEFRERINPGPSALHVGLSATGPEEKPGGSPVADDAAMAS
ncbi:MAG: hypothetical protein ACI9U2_002606 [Bradymonadia bacterium]|jgi:hypothetical protein